MTEIFKNIPGFEGLYQVSNLGRVKSLARVVEGPKGPRNLKERILKPGKNSNGYLVCILYKYGKRKAFDVHQLAAIAFLDHVPNGKILVVNHKNFNRTDNRVENLEIVTMRENGNKKHLKSTSEFTGVSWNKQAKKWHSQIAINGGKKYLGLFANEIDAANAYNNYLKQITK